MANDMDGSHTDEGVTLESLYKGAMEMAHGVADLDKQVGVERDDYGPVFRYCSGMVLDLETKRPELERLAEKRQ